jgi:aerobic carbon-monoxide dehydrogenase medium subunit
LKPRNFEYLAPNTLAGAYDLLTEHGDEAKAIAGGQSLVPMMNLRVASPTMLIDIGKIDELHGITRNGDMLRIAALTRHNEIASSDLVARCAPLLAKAVKFVAHMAVRNRGTFGGSCCHADPSAEFPACCVLLHAVMELGSARGSREVSASEFFEGPFTTAIAPDELLLAVHIPVAQPDALFAFRELSRRHGDFAMSGVAARARRAGERWNTDWVAFGVSDRPVQLSNIKGLFDEIGVAQAAPDRVRAALAQDLQLDLYEEGIEIKRIWTAELIDRCRAEFADWYSGRAV